MFYRELKARRLRFISTNSRVSDVVSLVTITWNLNLVQLYCDSHLLDRWIENAEQSGS